MQTKENGEGRNSIKHESQAPRDFLDPPDGDPRPIAIVSMASGNNAGRAAVVMAQSLRDVGTDSRIEVVVMLQRGGVGSPECRNDTWKKLAGREHVRCADNDTVPEEIVSPRYLEALRRLNVSTVVTDEIPRTPYTLKISGGRHSELLCQCTCYNVEQWSRGLGCAGRADRPRISGTHMESAK